MNRALLTLIISAVITGIHAERVRCEPETINIGFNFPLTGELSAYGDNGRRSVLLLQQRIKKRGGIRIDGRLYSAGFIIADNGGSIETALSRTLELITQKQIVAMIGPLASSSAIPAGHICNTYETPMIAPSCVNPMTTKNRPYVFRMAFLDAFQGIAAARLAVEHIGAETAAVIYADAETYSRDAAKAFKLEFETGNGKRRVAAFESFRPGEKEYWVQIEAIVESKADVLFMPLFPDQIPDVMRRVRRHGFQSTVIGGEGWGEAGVIRRCGDDCVDCYYIAQFSGNERSGAARDFAVSFRDEYGYRPDAAAALTWDSVRLTLDALRSAAPPGKDIGEYRRRIRDRIAGIENFKGVSGKTAFNSQGDPEKEAAAVMILPGAKTVFHGFVRP